MAATARSRISAMRLHNMFQPDFPYALESATLSTTSYESMLFQYQNGTCYEVAMCDNENTASLEKKQLREMNQMNQPSLLLRRNFLPSTKRKAIEER